MIVLFENKWMSVVIEKVEDSTSLPNSVTFIYI